MSKKIQVTAKNFKTILAGQVRAFGSFRERMQDLLAFAMVQASNENYTYVNELVCANLKGANHQGIKRYIEDHCDLQLISENGVRKFKSKKTRGFKFVMPTVTWYDYDNSGEITVIEPETVVISLINRLNKAVGGEGKTKVAAGHVKEAKAIIAHLRKTPGIDLKKLAKTA